MEARMDQHPLAGGAVSASRPRNVHGGHRSQSQAATFAHPGVRTKVSDYSVPTQVRTVYVPTVHHHEWRIPATAALFSVGAAGGWAVIDWLMRT